MGAHFISCSSNSDDIENAGTKAEVDTAKYLIDNLNISRVGNYLLLVNYNLPYKNTGSRGTLEFDLILINRFGVFPIEVKDYYGRIEAYDGYWIQNQKYKLKDFFGIVEKKSRILHGILCEKLSNTIIDIEKVSVTPIIVLYKGIRNFTNLSTNKITLVTCVDHYLIEDVSSNRLLRKGPASRLLNNDEIKQLTNSLYSGGGKPRDDLVGQYHIVGELSPGDMFDAFEGMHSELPNKRARIKVYEFSLGSDPFDKQIAAQSTKAISKMGNNLNILQTYEFFRDQSQPNKFYEITEPVQGLRLDEFLEQYIKSMPLDIQFAFIDQLCNALKCAHENEIYHRHLSPETIFIDRNNTLKIADFDYAKIVGEDTLVLPESARDLFDKNPFIAPELRANVHLAEPVSDIYSLGVIWIYIASLPNKNPKADASNINKLNLPKQVRSLILAMTDQIPDNRPQKIERIQERISLIKSEIKTYYA